MHACTHARTHKHVKQMRKVLSNILVTKKSINCKMISTKLCPYLTTAAKVNGEIYSRIHHNHLNPVS